MITHVLCVGVAVPVSVGSDILSGNASGMEVTNAVMYPSSAGMPTIGGSLAGSQEVGCRPQTVSIQPQTDMIALQNWDMSPISANIASLLCDTGSVVPQAPGCPVTDM